jgi:hypothetical protein
VIDLSFEIGSARAKRSAAVPTLVFDLGVEEASSLPVSGIALNCQIRIEPQRRHYSDKEERKLLELFGEPARWRDTLKPFFWTQVSLMVSAFEGTAEVPLPVGFSYDFEVGSTKYFHALDDGEIHLLFLFSGMSFAKGEHGLLVNPIPWSKEARYRLPVRVWRELMDAYYPESGFLRLQRETLDALLRFKAERALPTWDGVVEELLKSSERGS